MKRILVVGTLLAVAACGGKSGGGTPPPRADPPSALTYSPSALTCSQGTPCGLPAPAHAGGAIASFDVSPALPAGLVLDPATGAIGGTAHQVVASSAFTVTGRNSAGSTDALITITVLEAAPIAIAYSGGLVCQRSVPCSLAPPAITGGTPTRYDVAPALPAGLAVDPGTGAIGGLPTGMAAAASYTVTGSNGRGAATVDVSVTVNELAPAGLVYAATSLSCTVGEPCQLAAPACGGGPVTSFAISPALPAGLLLDVATGAIGGTATAIRAASTYQVTATNSGGTAAASVFIAVHDRPPAGLAYPAASVDCGARVDCTFGPPTSTGGAITSYTIAPPLPGGLLLSPTSGTLTGRALAPAPAATYTVTGSNAEGSTTASFVLSVVELPPAGLSYDPGLACTAGVSCSRTPTSTGGQITTYSVSPAPPAWVTFDTATGAVSGTPPGPSAPVVLSVTGSNAGGSTTAPLPIAVFAPMADLPPLSGSFTSVDFAGFGIDPVHPDTMYLVDTSGRAFGSTDAGATWSLRCRIATGTRLDLLNVGNVLVSPTGAAFAGHGGQMAFRIAALSGGPCPKVPRSLSNSGNLDGWIAFTSTGRAYNWTMTEGLGYSDDDGATWTPVSGSANSLYRSLGVDPFDDSRLLSVHGSWGNSPVGILLGASTVLTSAFTDYQYPVLFDPAHQGHVFLGGSGVHSADGGATWARDAASFGVQAFDAAGGGYRLEVAGGLVRLRKSPDLHVATPTWSTLATFAETALAMGANVKVGGTNVLVRLGTRIYRSTDGGATFGPAISVSFTSMPAAATAGAARGQAIYLAVLEDIFRSSDDGATWSQVGGAALPNSRIHVSLQDPARAYVRAEFYTATLVDTLVHTSDGFASFTKTSNFGAGWYSWVSVFALDQVDDRRACALGTSHASTTTDSGASWTTTLVADAPYEWKIWNPGHAAEVNPWNGNQVFYMETSVAKLFLYDQGLVSNTEITGRLPFTDPAGLEVVRSGAADYRLRVVSRQGGVAESVDGVTFTLVNRGGGLASAPARILRTSPTNPSLLATVPLRGDGQVALSYDGGASWLAIAGGCATGTTRDLAFTATRLLLICDVSQITRALQLP